MFRGFSHNNLLSLRFLLASCCCLLLFAAKGLATNNKHAHQETGGGVAAQQRAVEVAVVTCSTTKGEVEMTFYQNWSPQGYDRAVKLFQEGFYDHSHFFRVVPDFLVQFGISYTTNAELQRMSKTPIPDDDQVDNNKKIPFEPGTISFAGSGRNSRTSHLFISFMTKDNPNNQFGVNPWETPVGKVTKGLQEVVQQWYSGYGDMPPWGQGPEQQKIYEGPQYIDDNFPQLDKFFTCQVETTKMIKVVDNDIVDSTEEEEEEATTSDNKSQDKAGKMGKVKGETTTETAAETGTETETTLSNDSNSNSSDDNSSEDSNDSEEDASSSSDDQEKESSDEDDDEYDYDEL